MFGRITKTFGKYKKTKRRGQGYGSGKGGHTSGRGTKGQKARNSVALGFEGGQVPLFKRLPQIGGFRNPTKKDVISVSLSKLNVFKNDTEVTPKHLLEQNIIRRLPKGGIKLLSNGELERKLILKGFMISKAALEKVLKAGSKVS